MTKNWVLIQTSSQMVDALKKTTTEKTALVIDTETNGLRYYAGDHIIGVSWYLPDHDISYYAPFRHEHTSDSSVNLPQSDLDHLIQTFNDRADIPHIFFNALFDMHMLSNEGYDVPDTIEDLMIAAQLANENEYDFGRRYGLKYLAKYYLTTEDYDPVAGEDELKMKAAELGVDAKKEMYKMPPDAVGYYAAMDVILTWQLREKYLPVLAQWKQTKLYTARNLFMRLALFPMERRGMPVDLDVAQSYIDDYTPKMEALQDSYPDVNLSSPTKLSPYLKKRGIIKGYKTDKPALVEAKLNGHQIAEDVLAFRHMQKQNGFYASIIGHTDPDGMLRTHYNLIGAGTGRLSAYDPNPQQFPKKAKDRESFVKKCFIVPPGWTLIQWDYSQLELRLAAHYAKQKLMIERYWQNIDQHQATADMLTYELGKEMERKVGKAANFGLLYGMGARKARQQWGVQGVLLDLRTAQEVVKAWKGLYPEFEALRWRTMRLATIQRTRPDGSGEGFQYIQYPYNGRTRKYHEYKWWQDLGFKSGWSFAYETSKSMNSLIQGTGAGVCEDGITRTMLVYGKYPDMFWPAFTVHDSFGAFVKDEYVAEVVPHVCELMSDLTSFSVQLPVEPETSKTTWYDLEEYVG